MAIFFETGGSFTLEQLLSPSEVPGSFDIRLHGFVLQTWDDWRTGTLETGAIANEDTLSLEFTGTGGRWTSSVIDMQTWEVNAWDGWDMRLLLDSGATAVVEARSLNLATDTPAWVVITPNALPLTVQNFIQFRVTVSGGTGTLMGLSMFWTQTPESIVSHDMTSITAGSQKVKTNNRDSISTLRNTPRIAKQSITVKTETIVPAPLSIKNFHPTGHKTTQTTAYNDDYGSSVATTFATAPDRLRKEIYLPAAATGNGSVVLEVGIVRLGHSRMDTDTTVNPSAVGPIWMQLNTLPPVDIRPLFASSVIEGNLSRISIPVTSVLEGLNVIEVWNEPVFSEKIIAGLDGGPVTPAAGSAPHTGADSFVHGTLTTPITTGELRFWVLSPEQHVVEDVLTIVDIPVSADVIRPFGDLTLNALIYQRHDVDIPVSATVLLTRNIDIAVNATISAPLVDFPVIAYVVRPLDLQLNAQIVKHYTDIPVFGYVTPPKDLPINAYIPFYKQITAFASIIQPFADLPTSAKIAALLYLPASAYITAPRDLTMNATIGGPFSDIPVHAMIQNTQNSTLGITSTVYRPYADLGMGAYINGTFVSDLGLSFFIPGKAVADLEIDASILRPFSQVSASALIGANPTIPIILTIVQPSVDMGLSAQILSIKDLPVFATIEQYSKDFTAIAIITIPTNADIPAQARIMSSVFNTDLNASANIGPLRFRSFGAQAFIQPHSSIPAAATIIQPSIDLQLNAFIILRQVANVIQDTVYVATNDNLGADIQTLTPLNFSWSDTISISGDGDSAPVFVVLPILPGAGKGPLPESGILTFTETGPSLALTSDDNANWGPPTKLTNNLNPDEVVQNPFFGEVEGDVVVGFELLDQHDHSQILVIKTDDLSAKGVWAPAKRLEGQYGSIAAGAIRYTGNDGIYEWRPPMPGNEVYAQEANFTPIGRRNHIELAKAWDILVYEQQKTGVLVYPPPEWGSNPLNDTITLHGHEVGFTPDASGVFPRNVQTDLYFAQTTEQIIIG